jgi:predicted negative regulator of RcsB-dependent stress response
MPPAKRLTRKDLRQPDLFQRTTKRVLEGYEENRRIVWLAISALVLIVLAIVGFQIFKERQESAAAQEFAQAIDLYHGSNYEEAASAFEDVQRFRWSRYAHLAHLYQANAYIELNDLDRAATSAQRFLVGTRGNTLMRQIGLFTLGNIEERRDRCNEALQHYEEAVRITGAFRELALLGKARCSEKTGDLKNAVAAYREYLKAQPTSPIALQLRELESKLAAQP